MTLPEPPFTLDDCPNIPHPIYFFQLGFRCSLCGYVREEEDDGTTSL